MTLLNFLFLLLAVQLHTCVTALDPRSTSWSRALHIVGRQTSNIPSQCQTPCTAASALVNANCTPAQCCTSSFENNYVSCIECVGSAANITDYSSFQTIVDELVVQCSIQGIAIPKVTFPGQDENRPLSTSAIASSTPGTASGSSAGSSTPISQSTISGTSVITTATSHISASVSSIVQSTITSEPVSSAPASVTLRSSAPASLSTTPAASGTAPAASGTANSAVAMEGETLWMVPALVVLFLLHGVKPCDQEIRRGMGTCVLIITGDSD
ncbi:uncharacterized protein EV420DRAFT_1473649 [Desarmillaria tabescens]|uniref:Extracellular membrane protein CFEM domain-containing protein n=1 Tax=Armillaria tabescens TaxID=1929756 RepID=A0AA39NLF9_ARMTA|nr:uncharacterized protein EV420DRAFT_1473649 [Desarmillaria tabescens]KAK0467823.1 hypothetical protein EV420DRAFT_1473649 [Desarmillaria tabescens]